MTDAMTRVMRLVNAARRLADRKDSLGIEARSVLPRSTGLSREGVAFGLERCLETEPTEQELHALCASVKPSRRTHVLLSANVFVAAHRALALALASSSDVSVRPSRREPDMVRLLDTASAGGLFRRVPELEPEPGEHLWAYGSDETLDQVAAALPPGVILHRHGSGLGAAVIDARSCDDASLEHAALALAEDIVPFDQRGCLSPRVVIVLGDAGITRQLGAHVSRALSGAARRIPLGHLSDEERAAAIRYRDTMTYAGELFDGDGGSVGVDTVGGSVVVPPVGRNVHIVRTDDAEAVLAALRPHVVAVGLQGSPAVAAAISRFAPGARITALGAMQRPPLDGPVDRRRGRE